MIKKRTPDGWCAYKTGEFEVGMILIAIFIICLISLSFVSKEWMIPIFIFGLICWSINFVTDWNEIRRRRKIIAEEKLQNGCEQNN